jgi:uncharacterized protein
MENLSLTIALLMGLTGSLHCAGMCGPILLVMPFHLLEGAMRWWGIAVYHIGRVSTYVALGLVLYSFRSLFNPSVQHYVSSTMGLLLLLAGIYAFVPRSGIRFSPPWTVFVQNKLRLFIGSPKLTSLFVMGVLNGLLPCGLVYLALSAAVNSGSTAKLVAFMYCFGIGTMPMHIALVMFKNRVLRFNIQIKKIAPVVIICLGGILVVRGMNLGIPYLSPKIEITQHGIKGSCCHKNK